MNGKKKLFVVWTPWIDNSNQRVLGVYGNQWLSIIKCNEFNEMDEFDIIDHTYDNIICKDFSLSNLNRWVYCTKIQINKNINKLYFLQSIETDYDCRRQMTILFGEDEEIILNIAFDYFDNEHNIEDNCSECPNCKDEFIKSLRDNKRANINCTYYSDTSMEILTIQL